MAYEGGGFVNGCSACGCLSFNSVWYNTFGVLLCDSCRKGEKLITKSAAKQAYLLTDRDVSKLGTLSKTNPQHKNWKPMQLYLQSQVEEIAQRKHGSIEQLEDLRHDRMESKLNDRLRKRTQQQQQQQQQGQPAGDGQQPETILPEVSAAQRRIRSRLEEEYTQQSIRGVGPSHHPSTPQGEAEEDDHQLDVEEI